MAEEEIEQTELTEVENEVAASDAQQSMGGDNANAGGEVNASESGSYGESLIAQLSIEANLKKLVKYAKVPELVAHYLLATLYLTVGVLCIIMPEKIEIVLPYIVGGGMGAAALVSFIYAIVTREYRTTRTNKTAMSVIMMGLSVMIILEHEWAHVFIPIIWGVLGLFEGAHAFNHALSRISRGKRPAFYLIKGITEVVVAFLLLYRPEQYAELHIITFGFSLVFDGITVLPFISKYVAKD